MPELTCHSRIKHEFSDNFITIVDVKLNRICINAACVSWKKWEIYGLLDCLRFKKHPSHFNLDDIIIINSILKPKKIILTNLHSDFDYNKLLKILPNNIIPGYDGLSVNI